MFRSLRRRLMATMAGIILISLALLGYASSRAGKSQFRRLEEIRLLNTPEGTLESTETRTEPAPPVGHDKALFGAFNREILLAAGLSGALALLLTELLTRRIFGPVEMLTQAARRMEAGERHQRVGVGSDDEIGVLARSFNSMAASLERNEELRRRLISDVAHELRTPLTNLKAQLEAIGDGLLEPGGAEMASLREESDSLHRLIGDLEDLTRAEAHELRMDFSDVDLRRTIRKALAEFEVRAREAGVRLEEAIPPNLPPVRADERRLDQILRNLVENALAHTSDGGSAAVFASAAGTMARVTVSDSGSGISEEDLPHIFDRFYRADPSRTRASGGTGLGLAIVRELVRAGGGEVSARSQIGSGTEVTFSVPFIKNS